MSPSCRSTISNWAIAVAVLLMLTALGVGLAVAGGLIRSAAVGGVLINNDGLVSNPEPAELREAQTAWQAGLQKVPADLEKFTELRFVSLARLEAEIEKHREQLLPLPDAVRYLAGLQRIQYVLVYPDEHDIVLAGPAEGWRVDSLGNVVGLTSDRPVLMLDDLIVALRSGETSNATGISCSIDPTPEGLARVQQASRELAAGMSPEAAARRIEEALGKQVVSVTGVPATSHFARVLVAADFRMKRLAMNFEPAPIDGLPSYLQMASAGRGGMANVLPRWWLAPNYEPILKDAKGLAWEIRGQGVKCLTEQDVVSQEGAREHTGKADPVAQKWADAMTKQFEELANHDSAFGHLRNIMDLAVVGALVAKQRLLESAGLELPQLMQEEELDRYNAPREVASLASFAKKRGGWLISASGGVQIFPWQIADKTETDNAIDATRQAALASETDGWWWQAKK